MDPVDQRLKPVEVELSRNLQTYLQRLGLLPKTSSASKVSCCAALCWLCQWLLFAQFGFEFLMLTVIFSSS